MFWASLFNKVFALGSYPENWSKGYIINIHKKGSTYEPQNYRSITITSAIGKLFNLTLNNRLQSYLEKHNLITPLQIGFQKKSSTTDHILTLSTIIRKYTQNKSQRLYACFIDFQKAFDTIWHQGLLLKLCHLGINNNFFRIISSMYNKISLCVKTQGKLTDPFPSNIGVRQGDNLSPTLFNIFINDLPDYIKKEAGIDPIKVGTTTLNCLMYADDLVLLSTSKEGLQKCIDVTFKFSTEWRLNVNLDKTKILVFNKKALSLRKTSPTTISLSYVQTTIHT